MIKKIGNIDESSLDFLKWIKNPRIMIKLKKNSNSKTGPPKNFLKEVNDKEKHKKPIEKKISFSNSRRVLDSIWLNLCIFNPDRSDKKRLTPLDHPMRENDC